MKKILMLNDYYGGKQNKYTFLVSQSYGIFFLFEEGEFRDRINIHCVYIVSHASLECKQNERRCHERLKYEMKLTEKLFIQKRQRHELLIKMENFFVTLKSSLLMNENFLLVYVCAFAFLLLLYWFSSRILTRSPPHHSLLFIITIVFLFFSHFAICYVCANVWGKKMQRMESSQIISRAVRDLTSKREREKVTKCTSNIRMKRDVDLTF